MAMVASPDACGFHRETHPPGPKSTQQPSGAECDVGNPLRQMDSPALGSSTRPFLGHTTLPLWQTWEEAMKAVFYVLPK